MTRAEKAQALFKEGYNCAQAVVLACADCLNADVETLKSASAPFGGGVGRLREICGAVSGMMMVIGLAKPCDTRVLSEKSELYRLERRAAELFREREGAIVCRELLALHPHQTGGENRHKPHCVALIATAIEILEETGVVKPGEFLC